ncbi:uncharacterized protein LOC18094909 isoform X3 [Populus trichocarpa]|uniref:Uncharacterized protein n=1 Tax=Populus trichocarpa TaxID=3694 RepID=A0A3N7EK02_POPTR|nr:uncharacterized protein LOC18094909 isoform X3 [Populus trichocarpa]|eukprot:XP_024440599.1 uncharacterized protein LOC18094909 isoform X3 [Populus trichocarpa]
MGTGGNDTMFQASPFNLTEYTETCIEVFGGHDKNLHSEILQATSSSPMDFGIHTVLECFGGHIRHCCCCTYRTRVLEDISDSVVALYTEQASCIAECTMRGCYVKNLQKQDSGSSIQTNSRIICGHMDPGAMKLAIFS